MSKKDKPKYISAFPKSATCEVRMIFGPYKGVDIVNIREFKNWQGIDGEMRPTANGFTVKPEEYRKLVKAMVKFGRESGLIPAKDGEPVKIKKEKVEEEPKKKKTVNTEDEEDEEEDEEENVKPKKRELKPAKKKKLAGPKV